MARVLSVFHSSEYTAVPNIIRSPSIFQQVLL